MVTDKPSTAVTWWQISDVLAFAKKVLAKAGFTDKKEFTNENAAVESAEECIPGLNGKSSSDHP